MKWGCAKWNALNRILFPWAANKEPRIPSLHLSAGLLWIWNSHFVRLHFSWITIWGFHNSSHAQTSVSVIALFRSVCSCLRKRCSVMHNKQGVISFFVCFFFRLWRLWLHLGGICYVQALWKADDISKKKKKKKNCVATGESITYIKKNI